MGTSSILKSKEKLLLIVLGIFLGMAPVSFVMGMFGVVNQPYELIFGEGFLLAQVDLLMRNVPLYQPVGPTQLLIIPHTPLYVGVVAFLSNIFGLSMLVGRLVSLVSGLVLVVTVYLITTRLTGNRGVGVLASLLLVSTYMFRFLAPIYRMDTLGVMFCFLGIYLVMKFESKGRWVYLSIPVFILAFFTKQYYLIAPASVFVYLLVSNGRKFRLPLEYGILYGVLLVASIAVANILTNGQFVLHNFVYLSLASQITWRAFVGHLDKLTFYHLPLVICTLGYFGYKISRRRPLILIDYYFLIELVVVLWTIGKVGASFHYGFELVVLSCIMVGVLLNGTLNTLVNTKETRTVLVTLLRSSIVVLVAFQGLGYPLGQSLLQYQYTDTTPKAFKDVTSYMEGLKEPLFTDAQAYPLAVGTGIVWEIWEPALLYRGGLQDRKDGLGWDQSELVSRFETGYYKSVVLSYPLDRIWTGQLGDAYLEWVYQEKLSAEVSDAILGNYEFVRRTGRLGSEFSPFRLYIFEYKGSVLG